MVRDTIREFVSENVIPIIEKHNREATFPMQLVGPLAELGILGANLKGYGCPGLNNVANGLIMQELERGDNGLRSLHPNRFARDVSDFGSGRKNRGTVVPEFVQAKDR